MTDQPEPQHATPPAPQFTEAPYSGNVRARIRGYDWQLTIRAADSTTFTQKVEGLMNWLDTKADKMINVEPPATVSAPTAVPPAPGAPAPATTSAIQTIHAVKLQIEPRADGKVNLKFFEAGHQYADLTAVKTPAEAVAMLQPIGGWELAHMVASEYVINAAIDWKPSANLNKNGKPYKNIVTIAPSAQA